MKPKPEKNKKQNGIDICLSNYSIAVAAKCGELAACVRAGCVQQEDGKMYISTMSSGYLPAQA